MRKKDIYKILLNLFYNYFIKSSIKDNVDVIYLRMQLIFNEQIENDEIVLF